MIIEEQLEILKELKEILQEIYVVLRGGETLETKKEKDATFRLAKKQVDEACDKVLELKKGYCTLGVGELARRITKELEEI